MGNHEVIQSKDNELLKSIAKLKEKRYRVKTGEFIIEGFRFVEEALKSDFEVETVLISEEQEKRWNDFELENKLKSGIRVAWVKDELIKHLCSTENPQGIIAVLKKNKFNLSQHQDGGFYVLIDKLQDPGNLGTIIRTSHAAGASGVILTKGTVDPYNEKTLRATMGSIFRIPVIDDLNYEFVDKLREKGYKLIATSLEKSMSLYDADLKQNVILSVGNEGNGISTEVFERADIRVRIPMPGEAESLNVSSAAAILIFEAVRQRV